MIISSINKKLWSSSFIKIYTSNILLYLATYMILPLLPFEVQRSLHTENLYEAAFLLCSFPLALFFIGPFYSVLTDQYCRKRIAIVAFLLTIAVLYGYQGMIGLWSVVLFRFIQGVAFGLGTSLHNTLSLDITPSSRRSEVNITIFWSKRIGMFLAPAVGLYLYHYYSFLIVLYVAMACCALGVLLLSFVHITFYAPIGVPKCSFDRFFLIRGWLPALNVILISFVFGLLMPLFSIVPMAKNISADINIVFYAGLLISVLFSLFLKRKKEFLVSTMHQTIIGLALLFLGLLAFVYVKLSLVSAIIAMAAVGIGMALSTLDLLIMLVRLCEHCQRATANATYILSWEIGVSAGLVVGCFLLDSYALLLETAVTVSGIAFLSYLFITLPYFISHRLR
ncbi:MAG: MFS transporter [Bacteroidaceae bacterium]